MRIVRAVFNKQDFYGLSRGWLGEARRHHLGPFVALFVLSGPTQLFVACSVLKHGKRQHRILRQSWINLCAPAACSDQRRTLV
jgi:hypothetical protein